MYSVRGQPLGSREAGSTVPTVQIVAPADGEDVAYHDATFAWAGRDDDARLLVSVSDGLNGTWVETPPLRIR